MSDVSDVPICNIDYFLQRPEVRSLPTNQIDDLVGATAYTFYESSTIWPEVLTVSTDDADLWLSLAAISRAVVAIPELQRLVAIFDHRAGYPPLRRAYFYCCCQPGAVPFDVLAGMSRARSYSKKELGWNIRRPEFENTARQWAAAYRQQMAVIDKVAEGRRCNTAVDNVYVLSSPEGHCFMCGDKVFGFAMSTFGSVEAAAMIAAHLCEKHHALAQEQSSVLKFVLTFLGVDLSFDLEVKDHSLTEPIIELMMDIVRGKTGAKVDPPKYDACKQEYDVKIRFLSGFVMHLRLRSLCNYGYMLFDPNNKQLKRVDTAAHHSEKLVYGPAHLHLEPGVCNANVTDSFTYGVPIFDLKLILRLVDEAEQDWANHETGVDTTAEPR